MPWCEHREAFEEWAADLKRKPQDPAFALVHATNEQTRAIYALATIIEGMSSTLADMIDREETREERQRTANLQLYQTLSEKPHE